MRDTCDQIQRIISQWEEEGCLSGEAFKTFEAHLGACPSCSTRYAALLPIIEADVSEGAGGRAGIGMKEQLPSPGPDFTNNVMELIEKEGTPRKSRGNAWIVAAAASVLIVAGVLFTALFPLSDTPSPEMDYVKVHFTLSAPEAESVTLVGDFTEWEASEIKLHDPEGDGLWEAEVRLKKGDVYMYNFVIDGQTWVVDPDSVVQVDDGFGGESSLLRL
jgi:hypothetical protein